MIKSVRENILSLPAKPYQVIAYLAIFAFFAILYWVFLPNHLGTLDPELNASFACAAMGFKSCLSEFHIFSIFLWLGWKSFPQNWMLFHYLIFFSIGFYAVSLLLMTYRKNSDLWFWELLLMLSVPVFFSLNRSIVPYYFDLGLLFVFVWAYGLLHQAGSARPSISNRVRFAIIYLMWCLLSLSGQTVWFLIIPIALDFMIGFKSYQKKYI